jgi:rod shape-determining protein MreD
MGKSPVIIYINNLASRFMRWIYRIIVNKAKVWLRSRKNRQLLINRLLFLLILVFFSLFSLTALNLFSVFNVRPELFLISVFLAGTCFDLKWALFTGACTGVLKDALTLSAPFGLNTLALTLWAYAFWRVSRKISIDNNWVRMILVFLFVIAHNILVRILFLPLLARAVVPFGVFCRITFLESLYTAAVIPLVFMSV